MKSRKKHNIKPDVYLKEFWRDNKRFADLFNTVLFHGKQQLDPNRLQEMDSDLSSVLSLNGYLETLSRTRDVIKKTDGVNTYVIFGLESQLEVHYAMPLRNMLYDGLTYLKQVMLLQKQNRGEKKKKSTAEFLSGLKRDDRIHPVITIVLYYGEKEWDGPISLKDMMIPMEPEVEALFVDYKMHVVQVTKSDEYTFSTSELQTFFDVSRKIFRGEFESLVKTYEETIEQELAIAIGLVTGYDDLVAYSLEREEGIAMCNAVKAFEQKNLDLGRKEGKKEGRKVGRKEGIDLGIRLAKKVFELSNTGISMEEIAKECKITVEEVRAILL